MAKPNRLFEMSYRLHSLALAEPFPQGTRTIGPTGGLVVCDGQQWCGRTIWVEKRMGRVATSDRVIAEVREWDIDDTPVLAAVFPHLRPGTHKVFESDFGELGRSAEVIVDAGKVVWLNWS
ncbi:MAG: hypothetical protein QOJ59_3919 [Thermomicrobiales bacterium]|jgi:hypothetical protein|nr:hypothetical protein [Thermomicrobiales bacterium]